MKFKGEAELKFALKQEYGMISPVSVNKKCIHGDNYIFEYCVITAENEVYINVVVTKVTLNTTKANIGVGKTLTLKVTRKPITATDKITWTTSNKKIATVDKNGKVTVKKK